MSWKKGEWSFHKHDPGEIIGFFGSDHEDPYNLGGEIEFGEDSLLYLEQLLT